jgi:tetratricopeptide (TPR) repeat protein
MVGLSDLSHRAASEILILQFAAAISCGDFDAAASAMVDAKARSYGVGSPELESELRYYCGVYAWMQGRCADASAELLGLIEADSEIPSWLIEEGHPHTFNRGYWIARAYELLGLTAAREGDFDRQSAYLLKAFEEYDKACCIDLRVEATMLSNLAVLVRDLQRSDLAAFVRARCMAIRWSESIQDHHFLTLRALGWCSALGGDNLGGLRQFRESAEVAPTKPWRILALLDRAFIAGELHERFFASEELESACVLAAEVDWDRAVSADRLVLLDLARALNSVDVVRARIMLDRYFSVRSDFSSLEVHAKDRRRRGDECVATAAVVRAEQQLDRAAMLYKEAFEIWSDIGYAWRAAATALEIYSLTGESSYLDVVAREAAARPHSWIALRYASVVLDRSPQFALI